MKFDLSLIPADAEITKATLELYCMGSSEKQSIVDIRRVTGSWIERT